MKKSHVIVIVIVVLLVLAALLLSRCHHIEVVLLPNVEFVVPQEGANVGRDYNQRVFVAIKNSGPGSARLRLQSETLPDMPSGFVGRGTEDWEVPDTVLEIPVGEIWEAPLLVHANRAEKDDYQLTLHATHQGQPVASATLKLHVAKPKLELETAWLEPVNPADRARLQSVLRIRNTGAPIGDLAMHFEVGGKPADHELHWHPVVEEARLLESESMDVIVGPQLYPGFAKLAGEIVIRGLRQELRLPYAPQVPEGKAVFITLSRTEGMSTNDSEHCTNRPKSTYRMPPTNGTPTGGGGYTGGGYSGGSGGGGLVLTNPQPAPPKKDEDKDDGFGFLGVDTPPASPPKPGTKPPAPPKPTTATTDPDKKKKDKKSDPAPPPVRPTLPTELGGLGDVAPIGKLNDGLFANMEVNARAMGCGTMQLLDDEERRRQGLPPRPRPPEPAPLDGFKFPDVSKVLDTLTRKDPDQATTHLVRREADDGTNLLDFSFGIQDGERLHVPMRINFPITQPRLGPSPVKNGPALAAYTKNSDKGGTVAVVLDPKTGKKIELSPPDKKADSPVTVKNDGGVDAIHRQDGVLKRTHLKEDWNTEAVNGWPAGEKTGPILAAETRPDGKAVLLTKEADNKIMLRQPEGVRELPGRDAAISFSGKDAMIALQNDNGSIAVVDAGTGETRHTVTGSGHGTPSLVAMNDGGMRLSYTHPMPPAEAIPANASGHDLGGHFASDYKDGKWSEPSRLYMPESPVKNAAVAVEFTPPFASAHYKPMDISLDVNGRKIAEVKGRTPSGRYMYRVPTEALNYSTAAADEKTPGNEVTVNSKGIGPGNFHIAEKCSLYSLHDWTQGCFVAANSQEADQLAQLSSHDLKHGAPDLVLASNRTELPHGMKPGESVEMQVGVFNAGDRTSKPVTLQALGNDEKNGDVQIPALKPFTGTQAKINVTAPKNWTPGTPLKLTVAVPDEGDGDPATNKLDYYLFRDLDPAIAGPVRASAVDVQALPAGSVVEAAVASKAQPFESALRANRLWFRSPIPAKGDLQLEVTGPNASLVDRLDLFDEAGRALKPQRGQWPAQGTHVYLRVGLPDGVNLSDDTRLKLWWE